MSAGVGVSAGVGMSAGMGVSARIRRTAFLNAQGAGDVLFRFLAFLSPFLKDQELP